MIYSFLKKAHIFICLKGSINYSSFIYFFSFSVFALISYKMFIVVNSQDSTSSVIAQFFLNDDFGGPADYIDNRGRLRVINYCRLPGLRAILSSPMLPIEQSVDPSVIEPVPLVQAAISFQNDQLVQSQIRSKLGILAFGIVLVFISTRF
jgi:hypothetical protein